VRGDLRRTSTEHQDRAPASAREPAPGSHPPRLSLRVASPVSLVSLLSKNLPWVRMAAVLGCFHRHRHCHCHLSLSLSPPTIRPDARALRCAALFCGVALLAESIQVSHHLPLRYSLPTSRPVVTRIPCFCFFPSSFNHHPLLRLTRKRLHR
jgi:hypothetical protein